MTNMIHQTGNPCIFPSQYILILFFLPCFYELGSLTVTDERSVNAGLSSFSRWPYFWDYPFRKMAVHIPFRQLCCNGKSCECCLNLCFKFLSLPQRAGFMAVILCTTCSHLKYSESLICRRLWNSVTPSLPFHWSDTWLCLVFWKNAFSSQSIERWFHVPALVPTRRKELFICISSLSH